MMGVATNAILIQKITQLPRKILNVVSAKISISEPESRDLHEKQYVIQGLF